MQTLWDDIPIDLVLDEDGRLKGLADFAAVRECGLKSLDSLVAQLAADPRRAPLANMLRAAAQTTLVDGALLAQSLLKEPGILLGAMGHDYGVGDPPDIREDLAEPGFDVQWASATTPRDYGNFASAVFSSLQEAVAHVETSAWAASTLKWDEL